MNHVFVLRGQNPHHGFTHSKQATCRSITNHLLTSQDFFLGTKALETRWLANQVMKRRHALTGVLLSEKVFMLTELLSLSEDTEGGDGLLFSTGSCRCRYSRHARWMLPKNNNKKNSAHTVTPWPHTRQSTRNLKELAMGTGKLTHLERDTGNQKTWTVYVTGSTFTDLPELNQSPRINLVRKSHPSKWN